MPVNFNDLPFGEKWYLKSNIDTQLARAFSVGRGYDQNAKFRSFLASAFPEAEFDVTAYQDGTPATLIVNLQLNAGLLDDFIEHIKASLPTDASLFCFRRPEPENDRMVLKFVNPVEYNATRRTISADHELDPTISIEEMHQKALKELWRIEIYINLSDSTTCHVVEEPTGEFTELPAQPAKRIPRTRKRIVCEPEPAPQPPPQPAQALSDPEEPKALSQEDYDWY